VLLAYNTYVLKNIDYIKKISFTTFKNLAGEYELSPEINLLIKENGWGKTNFLEAFDYLSHLKSFRGIEDGDLPHWDGVDSRFAKLTVDIEGIKKRLLQIVLASDDTGRKSKKVMINSVSTTFSKFRTNLLTLLYSPHNADIVSSSPQIRRDQFDRIIEQFDEKYAKVLREYKFVLKSRNKILQKLKGGVGAEKELEYWTERLVQLGELIIEKRILFLVDIQKEVQVRAKGLINGGNSELEIAYESKSFDPEKKEIVLGTKLEENIDKEIAAGLGLYGPHRDKFVFYLNGRPLREYGSRGQQRLAGLVLIFSLYKHFHEKLGKWPILLLDDIMSELDSSHRKKVEQLINKEVKTQVVITSSEKNYFTKEFIKSAKLI